MDRYADGVRAALESAGVTVEARPALHLNVPRPLRPFIHRYRVLPPLPHPWPSSVDLLHFTDFYLAGHSRDFPGPRVATVHDLMPEYLTRWFPPKGLDWRVVYARSLRYLPGCDAILTPSSHTRREVAARVDVDPERIFVVPVLMPPQFQPDETPRTALPTVICIGTANPNKNVEMLLHALAVPGLAHVRLIHVGKLSDEQLRLAARLGMAHRLETLRRVPEPDLLHLIRSSWALVQPSMDEGFGIPVAEAMACGVPVVCSDGGALPEVAGNACRVVPLRQHRPGTPNLDDARDFAAALQEVLNDEGLRSRMVVAGLVEAERFRIAPVREALLTGYRAAAAFAKARTGA